MPDWAKMKAEYIAGTTYRRLAEKYKVSHSSLMKRGAAEKWKNLRKKTERKVEEKIVEKISSEGAAKAVQISDVAENLLRQIALQVANGAFADSQSIRQITAALKDIKELKGDDKAAEVVKIVWSDETEEYSK